LKRVLPLVYPKDSENFVMESYSEED